MQGGSLGSMIEGTLVYSGDAHVQLAWQTQRPRVDCRRGQASACEGCSRRGICCLIHLSLSLSLSLSVSLCVCVYIVCYIYIYMSNLKPVYIQKYIILTCICICIKLHIRTHIYTVCVCIGVAAFMFTVYTYTSVRIHHIYSAILFSNGWSCVEVGGNGSFGDVTYLRVHRARPSPFQASTSVSDVVFSSHSCCW